MVVSVEIVKNVKVDIYNTVFLPSVESVDDILMMLPLMKQIFKEDVNFMCISFSVKHPQIYRES